MTDELFDPEQPYAGTSGHSRGATSRERAERNDASGLTSERQARVIRSIIRSGRHGRTCAEVENALGVGHGSVSGALTVLHKAERIVRLAERRSRQFVYVMPDQTDGRAETEYTPNPARAELEQVKAGIEVAIAHLEEGRPHVAVSALRGLR